MEGENLEFTSLGEISALVERFEGCALAPDEFGHRQHLAVALHYLIAGDLGSATESMRTGLKKLLAHHGIDGYNETITRFWLRRLDSCLTESDRASDEVECVNRVLAANADAKLIYQYFSREHLMTDTAKRECREPDLRPCEN